MFRETRSEQEIYEIIAKQAMEHFNVDDDGWWLVDEIFKAKADSDHSVHCFFGPSKAPGWTSCIAYLDRQVPWQGTKEPAIRGTIAHHFLSKTLTCLKSKGAKSFEELDGLMKFVYEDPEWLSVPGIQSAKALVAEAVAIGLDKVETEAFLMSPEMGLPNRGLRFGGSIDVLAVDEEHSTIHIYDLKTGKNKVQPTSAQLWCYAMLAQEKYGGEWGFVLGIAQDGKVEKVKAGWDEFVAKRDHIRTCFYKYEAYLFQKERIEAMMDEGQWEEDGGHYFNPCKYCQFCSGCYKRDNV